jgi:membrane-associated phospholipid phosphatase
VVLNIEIIKFIQSFSNPFLDGFFELVTILGEDIFFILVVSVVFWCINKDFGYKIGFAYLVSGIINTSVKEIFKVPRPIGHPEVRSLRLETAPGYSFPSGHTQQNAVLWYSWMVEFKKRWLYILGIFFILLVGLSRLYLGVHTPLDVLGGIIIGLICIFLSNSLFEWAKREDNPLIFLIFIIPMLLGMYFFPTGTYYKAAGTITGFWLGYNIETKYIQYQVQAPLLKQIIKYILGLAGLLAIKTFVKMLLPEAIFSDFIRYTLLGLWLTVAAPLLFRYILGVGKAKKFFAN